MAISVPAAWKASGDGDSRVGEEPLGDDLNRAKLELTLWNIEKRPAELCVKQVAEQLSRDSGGALPDGGAARAIHFDPIKAGGQPAIRNVVFDYVSDTGTRNESNKVSTVTVVGCDGSTRWLITMTSAASKSPRYGALLKKIIDSIHYDGK